VSDPLVRLRLVDLRSSPDDLAFRAEIRDWLETALSGEFAVTRGRGGPGDEGGVVDERLAWERHLGASGWTCVGWPTEHGGRGLPLMQQVIFNEEYARAKGPGRLGHIGETLLGPTLIEFGDDEQRSRFLPGIRDGSEIWCQGYSEPDAGSDLANVGTRAELDGDDWVINGQKVWTSWAQWSQWCFVLCRTDWAAAPRHRGISYLLVPMDQPGVEIRPIRQITGDADFNEVFFHDARTSAANIVGEPNQGWKVAMGTLAFERGASTLGQQLGFTNEFDAAVELARRSGRLDDPALRQRVADAWIGLQIMRLNGMRMLSNPDPASAEAMISKLFWSNWHRDFGELAVDLAGPDAMTTETGYELSAEQQVFMFSRSDTIYAGSNEIQRNIIGERALALPKEPR